MSAGCASCPLRAPVVAARPGYWGRSVIDLVADTTAVLAAIGASECLVAGHSGGGPHVLACAGEASLRPHLEAQRTELLAAGVDDLTAALSGLLPSPDLEAMRGELGEDAVSGFHEALRVGVDGWVDDDLAFTSPWGFSVGDIQTPVTVWQGAQDLMVPVAHGRWLAQVVPGADGHVLPGEGHLSLVANRAGRMLDALIGLG